MSNVNTRLVQAIGAMPAVGKDARNDHQKFQYRSIEAIVAAARGALAGAGLSLQPAEVEIVSNETLGKGARAVIRVIWRLASVDGDTVTIVSLGEGIDTFDKATSKAMTFAWKTALSQLLMISSEADPDGGAPDVQHGSGSGDASKPAGAARIEKDQKPGDKLYDWLLQQTAPLTDSTQKEAAYKVIADTLQRHGYERAQDVKTIDEARAITAELMPLLAEVAN